MPPRLPSLRHIIAVFNRNTQHHPRYFSLSRTSQAPEDTKERNVPISSALSGKHALITGGSRGIGLAIARLFATHSCRITILSRNPDTGSEALRSLAVPTSVSSTESYHTSLAGDIASAGQEGFLCDETDQVLDWKADVAKVDILVNAAGVTLIRLLVRSSIEDVQRIVQTNLTGSMLMVQTLLKKKLMRGESKRQGKFSPVVINLASLLAVQGGRGSVAYSASKAGVLGLTRALAAELGPTGIRVNAIVPGYIETDMISGKQLMYFYRQFRLGGIPCATIAPPT
ncbi:NAD(P)-binding protein [Mytilinidion resinicola]|uniref:NAD(P)-binding protein n=1 Tax=Mytilinidion resinicola TaxID=574789 RepID=A0A6A6Y7R8_9PEZI|nr:NAD(P)-binding protein [Mytilinidion resinicola]KAF2804852.1 NAD(P)-binding protein [Mytilinidion resinicola]